jgi:hypothetical protein
MENTNTIDKSKILIITSLILSLMLSVYLIVSLVEIKRSMASTQSKLNESCIQMKQLEDSIVRSQSFYVTPDQLDLSLSELGMEDIKKDLDKLNANVEAINTVLVKTPGLVVTKIGSSGTRPKPPSEPQIPLNIPCVEGSCVNPDKFNYLNAEQLRSLNEPFNNISVPFGEVTFKAWEEKPWSLKIFPRAYSVNNVISQNEEGDYIVHNQFNIEVDNKKYPIDIINSTTAQKNRESEFWFNPKLYLGVGVGPTIIKTVRAELVPTLEVSLFSYGPHKKQSTWSFLGLGIGAHTQELSPVVSITPVSYNVGEPLPLLDNLFIGPTVSADVNGNVSVTGSVKVGL